MPEEFLLGQFIPVHYHFHMLRDQSRVDPFREAIEHVVPVGGTVAELGGGTGILSWFAAQRARKVWCVERNPALVQASRSFLSQNPCGDRVEVVHADAMSWLPPEPVDVVICEMLHVALVREKQVEVLQSFKERYQQAFGPRLPRFIPETTLLGIQPIQQDFNFSGYTARVPMFEPPGPHMEERLLADAAIYSTIDYASKIPAEFSVEICVRIQRAG
ncbi:MAG: methyltransferase type 12, partial [Planctomycetales bacterium 12-60-4]